MTDPQAPQLPGAAPQDVRDFFACRTDRLTWRAGPVAWLGLPTTPDVSFSPGTSAGAVTINVSLVGGMVSFGLPASVNAAGELVIDAGSIPDLSSFGAGSGADIDAAVRRVNDWFRANGKKLKPATLRDGALVLDKTPIAADQPAPAAAAGHVPKPVPPPVAPVVPGPRVKGGGQRPGSRWGCGLFGALLVGLLGVTVGAYVLSGGFSSSSAPPLAATSVAPSDARASEGQSAAPSAISGAPTSVLAPASSSPGSSSPAPHITAACVKVVHHALDNYVSYLLAVLQLQGAQATDVELQLYGANDDQLSQLDYDLDNQYWSGELGLHRPGKITVVGVTAYLADGSTVDLTNGLSALLGGNSFKVRYPQQDTFGSCPSGPPGSQPPGSPVVGATTVTSNDGLAGLTLPVGALPAGVAASIRARGQADLPPELSGIQTHSAFYDLLPAGTRLAQPALFYRDADPSELGTDPATSGFPVIALAQRSATGSWSWLDSPGELFAPADPSNIRLSGQVSTLDPVFGFGGSNFVDSSASGLVDGQLRVQVELHYAPGLTAARRPALGQGVSPYMADPEAITWSGHLLVGPPGDSSQTLVLEGTCAKSGTWQAGVYFDVANVGADSSFLAGLGLAPVTIHEYTGFAITCP